MEYHLWNVHVITRIIVVHIHSMTTKVVIVFRPGHSGPWLTRHLNRHVAEVIEFTETTSDILIKREHLLF
jgi:hypothetical protein